MPCQNSKSQKKVLNFYYQNVRGLRTKTKTFFLGVIENNFDIIVLTETWLSSDIFNVELFGTNYVVYRFDRTYSRGGGVLVAVRSNYSCKVINLVNLGDCEVIWITFKVDSQNFAVGVHYITPNSNVNRYIEHCSIITNIVECFDDSTITLVFGDFNLPHLSWTQNLKGMLPTNSFSVIESQFIDTMTSLDLTQINNVFNFRSRLLDLVFVSGNFFELKYTLEESHDCLVKMDEHHKPILLALELVKTEFVNTVSESYYDYSKGDFRALNSFFNDIDWIGLFDYCDLDCAVKRFYEIVSGGIDKFIPVRVCRQLKMNRWFDKELRSAKNKANRLHKKFKHDGNSVSYLRFQNARRDFKKLHRLKYRRFINGIEDGIKNVPKRFWSFINSKRGTSGYPRTFNLATTESDCTSEISNSFSKVFSSNFLVSTNSANCQQMFNNFSECVGNFGTIKLETDSVFKYISNLKPNHNPGPDLVPAIILRECAHSLTFPLELLFNRSLALGYIPDCWKISFVIPVYKSGNRSLIENYRPISILSATPKVFECMVRDIMIKEFCRIIIPQQHGFFPGRSAASNLVEFVHFAINSIETGSQVDVVFTDFKKAFDRISHEIVLFKLLKVGVHSNLLLWMKSYLCNRKQAVKFGKCLSDEFEATSGVPQGSHLGPLLFLIFINDVNSSLLTSKFLLYADDMKIFVRIEDLNDCVNLQKDLDRFFLWCESNNLELNLSKCRVMSFHRKKNPINFEYKFNKVAINRVCQFEDLGIILDESLTFIYHTEKILNKANAMMGFMFRSCKDFKDVATFKVVYNALVRSQLEYLAIIWNPQYEIRTSRIESVQRRFTSRICRCILKSQNHIPYSNRCNMFQMVPLYIRRSISSACFIFDLLNNSIDSAQLLSSVDFMAQNLNIRNRFLLRPRFHRTNYGSHNPMDMAINHFNSHYDVFDFNISKKEFKERIIRSLNIM